MALTPNYYNDDITNSGLIITSREECGLASPEVRYFKRESNSVFLSILAQDHIRTTFDNNPLKSMKQKIDNIQNVDIRNDYSRIGDVHIQK